MSKLSASRSTALLIKSVSFVVLSAALAGCASDTVRFSDGFYTGAVPSEPVGPTQTPFPQNAPAQTYDRPTYQSQAPVYAPQNGSVDRTYTGSVPAGTQVQRQPLASPAMPTPVANVQPAPAPTPKLDPVNTASVAPAPSKPAERVRTKVATSKEGWSAAGGTYVTMREGETVYNLAKRYGVPANAIMEANNISNPKSVDAGTRVIIPTYVYSRTAPISAPDNSAAVRSASSNVGGRSEFPANTAPVPSQRPRGTQVASLAPVAAAAAAPKNAITTGKYAVSSGDTLSRIAQRTGTSVTSIKRLNGLSTDSLRIGQTLLIPGVAGNPSAAKLASAKAKLDPVTTDTKTPTKVAGYTPPKSKVTTKGSISNIDSSSTASAPAETGVDALRWPVKGRVVSSFGSNVGGKGNDGIDISVPQGSTIKAAENGVVIYSGDGLKEFGKTVLVRHGNGLVTVYGHLSSISVNRGDNVSRGQAIGASGMTGRAKQPQLHFEVRKNTSPVNPMTYLR